MVFFASFNFSIISPYFGGGFEEEVAFQSIITGRGRDSRKVGKH